MSSLSRSSSDDGEVASAAHTNEKEVCIERTYLLYNIQLPIEMMPNGIRDYILTQFKGVPVGGYAQRTYTEREHQCVKVVLRSTSHNTLSSLESSLLVGRGLWFFRAVAAEVRAIGPSDDLQNFQVVRASWNEERGGVDSRSIEDNRDASPHISGSSSRGSLSSSSLGGSAAATAERQNAARHVDIVQGYVDDAQRNVDTAQQRVDVAKQRVEKAKQRVEKEKQFFEEAKERVDAAQESLLKAQQDVNAASDIFSTAQQKLEQAKKDKSCVADEQKHLRAEHYKLRAAFSAKKLLLSQAGWKLSYAQESLSQEQEFLSDEQESLLCVQNSLILEERWLESTWKHLETTQQLLAAITAKISADQKT